MYVCVCNVIYGCIVCGTTCCVFLRCYCYCIVVFMSERSHNTNNNNNNIDTPSRCILRTYRLKPTQHTQQHNTKHTQISAHKGLYTVQHSHCSTLRDCIWTHLIHLPVCTDMYQYMCMSGVVCVYVCVCVCMCVYVCVCVCMCVYVCVTVRVLHCV